MSRLASRPLRFWRWVACYDGLRFVPPHVRARIVAPLLALFFIGCGDGELELADAGADAAPEYSDATPDAPAAPDAAPDAPACGFEHAAPCGSACDPGLHSVHVTRGAPQTCERLPLNPGACGGLYEACCPGEACGAVDLGCDLTYGMPLCVD